MITLLFGNDLECTLIPLIYIMHNINYILHNYAIY